MTVLAILLEWRRLRFALKFEGGFATWLTYWDMESTIPLIVLLSFPLFLLFTTRRTHRRRLAKIRTSQGNFNRACAAAVLVFVLSVMSSLRIGTEPFEVRHGTTSASVSFFQLPPAYHDEYSYLLQARTFRELRLSYPPCSVRPDLFHQIHVLNEPRTVSRYFPTTGLWIAAFDAAGPAIYGHWLAGAVAAVFYFLTMLQFVRFGTALPGGILIAVSPGIAVFSNLLLAHHPTILALSIFTWSFFRMVSTSRMRFAFVAGFALTFAMLARPMSAAGYSLPFGIWMAWQLGKDRMSWRLSVGFAIPLCVGLLALAIMNQDATGNWSQTAYGKYTEEFTPRHRFGFNNAVDTPTSKGPPAVKSYDEWATNLTASKAAENVWNRLYASFQWTLAVIPLVFGLLMAAPILLRAQMKQSEFSGETEQLLTNKHSTLFLRLLACSILTLHAVHIPYWYDGILHWHYVFETAPLLLILAAVGFSHMIETTNRVTSSRQTAFWVFCLVLAGLLPGWVRLPMFDGVSRTSAAISEQAYSRLRFEYFRRSVSDLSIRKPALIMVDERNTDPQLSYIINSPELKDDVIVCRRPEADSEIKELQSEFEERTIYTFSPSTFAFELWSDGTPADE